MHDGSKSATRIFVTERPCAFPHCTQKASQWPGKAHRQTETARRGRARWKPKSGHGLTLCRPKGAKRRRGRSISCICRVTPWASARSSGRCLSSSAPSQWSILSGSRAARTDKEWRDAAHSLKGSAQAIGAWGAAAAAEQAEAVSGEVLAATPPGPPPRRRRLARRGAGLYPVLTQGSLASAGARFRRARGLESP